MRTLNEIDSELSVLESELTCVKGRETEVYTRIVGYHRAVTNWNKGKREEYKDRVTFKHNIGDVSQKNSSTFTASESVSKTEENTSSNNNIAFYKLFQSQLCRNCPPVKEYVKKFPILGEEVDVSTDFGLNAARKYNVMSTPTVIFFDENDHIVKTVHSLEEVKQVLSDVKEPVAV